MSSYENFARNQRVVIRTSENKQKLSSQNNNSQSSNVKAIPPLDKAPAKNEKLGDQKLPPVGLDTIPETKPTGKTPDRHFTEEERKKKNKLTTYWRTRGSHDFILEQKKNFELRKLKKKEEAEFLKARREKALNDRMVEKKMEEAEAKGEIYIPEEEENETTNNTQNNNNSKQSTNQIERKQQKVRKLTVLGPNGQKLAHNIAFLGEKIDDNRAGEYYKQRKVKPGDDYDKQYGMDYDKKQKNHNMFDPLFCLCNPVYTWSRSDLFGDLKQEAEDVVHMLRYKTSPDGEPLYIMGNYRVGTFQQHTLWFPINTGFYLWFNILENTKKKFLLPGKLTWLEFDLTECQGKQLHIDCYLIDSTNNVALRKARTREMPDLKSDVIQEEGITFKSRVFSDTESVVYLDVTKAFEYPQSEATCLLWVKCGGKAWLGNAWAITKRPRIVFRDRPDKKSTKKKLNF